VDLWDSRFKKVDRERERRDNDWANNSTTSYNLFDLEEQVRSSAFTSVNMDLVIKIFTSTTFL